MTSPILQVAISPKLEGFSLLFVFLYVLQTLIFIHKIVQNMACLRAGYVKYLGKARLDTASYDKDTRK